MKAIVFIPGYKGSFLKSRSLHTRAWLSTRHIFPWNHTDLALGLSATGASDPNGLEPDGILDRLKLVPGVSKDIYYAFLEQLKNDLPHHHIIPFSYDWRLDLLHTIQTFHRFILHLREQGYTEINLIAHSMGGLLVAYWLKYGGASARGLAPVSWEGAKLVHRVVLAGVPFRGTSIALWYALQGNKVGLNRQLLRASTVSTFPVTYQMLPRLEVPTLYDDQTRAAIDLFDVTQWKAHGLAHRIMHHPEALPFIEQQLITGAAIKDRVREVCAAPIGAGVKLLNLSGGGYKTLHQIVWSKADASLRVPEESVGSAPGAALRPFADGDGIVTCDSSSLPEAYQSFGESQAVHVPHETFFHLEDMAKRMAAYILS